ncbi:hypothetical protein DACRYDRAFT_73553 [Dacryopinax primogenitus]|uniref:Uncharacterized protein n=1 Tax=Dacryopinax primogenitus (strain DJM 731) TaxID=1858805 RepID=M5GGW6_DACPD|nr:uncharacterized protein DACRYDRAFT_73553 [Dacryopinax primogenitus]EJU06203.1 hypothetical protein DACRYDRAFT_73553 [Dacryopinax primogenitus]
MRFSLALAAFSAISMVDAAYFSEGWKPGQAPPTQAIPPGSKQTSVPLADFLKPKAAADAPPRKGILELVQELQTMATDALTAPLKSGPVADIIQRTTGLNVSQAIERAKAAALQDKWDSRIKLITDDNWEDVIEYEQLSPEEEESRTWLILITLSEQNAVTQFVEEQFIKAFNETMDNDDDLPGVKWGRIDYFNVTLITTKWLIFKAPLVVMASHRGKDLRFFHPTQIKMRELHDIMKEELWKSVPPWRSSWGPGGENAWVLHHAGIWLGKYNDIAGKVPKWALMMVTGVFGSFVIQLLHGRDKKKAAPVIKSDDAAKTAPPPVAPTTPKKSPAETKKEASKRNRSAKRTAD